MTPEKNKIVEELSCIIPQNKCIINQGLVTAQIAFGCPPALTCTSSHLEAESSKAKNFLFNLNRPGLIGSIAYQCAVCVRIYHIRGVFEWPPAGF